MSSKFEKFSMRKEILAILSIIPIFILFVPRISPMPDFFLHYNTGRLIVQGHFGQHPFTHEQWKYMDELGKILVYLIGSVFPKGNITLSIRFIYLVIILLPTLLLALPKEESSLLTLIIPISIISLFVFTDLRPVLFTYLLMAIVLNDPPPLVLTLIGFLWTGIHGSWAVGAYYLFLQYLPDKEKTLKTLWYVLGAVIYSGLYLAITGDKMMTFHKLTSGIYWLLYFPKFGEWGGISNLTGVTLSIMLFIIIAILESNVKTGLGILPSIMLARLSPYSIIFSLKNTNWVLLEKKFRIHIKEPLIWSISIPIFFAVLVSNNRNFYNFKEVRELAISLPANSRVATLPPPLCYALFFYNETLQCGPKDVYKLGADPRDSEEKYWNYLMYEYPCELGRENYLIISKSWGFNILPALERCGVKVSKENDSDDFTIIRIMHRR